MKIFNFVAFIKKRKKTFLGLLLLIQSIAMLYQGHYHRTHSPRYEYKTLVEHEIHQLDTLWSKTEAMDILFPEKVADAKQLELVRTRVRLIEKSIQESESRVRKVLDSQEVKTAFREDVKEKREFFEKFHAYYHHGAFVVLAMLDFLLSKTGKYRVAEDMLKFDSEIDAVKYNDLYEQLSDLDKAKDELNAFVFKT